MIKKKFHNNFMALSLAGLLTLPFYSLPAAAQEPEKAQSTETQTTGVTNVPVKPSTKPQTRLIKPTVQRGQIISQVIGDVDGDGKSEQVMLMGNRVVEGSSYMGELYVISKDPVTGKVKAFIRPKDLGGYNAYLSLTDVTGNGLQNVLITAPTGGTAGVVDYRILDFSGKNPGEIFTQENNRGVTMVGSFLPNFKAKLFFSNINKEVIVDLRGEKEQYEHLSVYNKDGSLKASGVEPFIQNLGSLVTLDLNDDGTDDVITTQKVFGATNAHSLGYVRALWEYRAGTWQQKKINFQTNLYAKKTYSTHNPVKGISGYEIEGQLAELENNRVIYPRFTKISGPQQWKLNSQLENFAKNVLNEVRQGGQVELSYEVKYAGENYASILLKGTVVKDNESTPVLEAYNFNMTTGEDVSLEQMVKPFGGFWREVKDQLNKENISFTQKDIYGYYYDGTVLGLLYGDGKEFDVEPEYYLPYLRKNCLKEKILTGQSMKEKKRNVEKKIEKKK